MSPLSVAIAMRAGDLADRVRSTLRTCHARVVLDQPTVPRLADFALQVERLEPDVVILDHELPNIAETITRVRTVSSASVIVVHHVADALGVLACMRAGATDFVFPPVETALAAALERVTQAPQSRSRGDNRGDPRKSKVIGFLSATGGSGTTTIACHVAECLARITEKGTLLTDFDLTAGSVGFLMKTDTAYSVLDAVQNVARLDLTYWNALVSRIGSYLDVLKAPLGPLSAESMNPEPYREILRFARLHYDWTIADLGRGLTFFSATLLADVDEVFLVTSLEVLALYHTRRMVQLLHEAGFGEGRLHLLTNRTPKVCDFSPKELEKLLGQEVHSGLPYGHEELSESYASGNLVGRSTALGKSFMRLATKIAGIEEHAGPPTGFSFFGARKPAHAWSPAQRVES